MLSEHESLVVRATNDEGRLGFPRRPRESSVNEELDDRLGDTFLLHGPQIPQISRKSAICEATYRARRRDCFRQLLGAWLIAMERH